MIITQLVRYELTSDMDILWSSTVNVTRMMIDQCPLMTQVSYIILYNIMTTVHVRGTMAGSSTILPTVIYKYVVHSISPWIREQPPQPPCLLNTRDPIIKIKGSLLNTTKQQPTFGRRSGVK